MLTQYVVPMDTIPRTNGHTNGAERLQISVYADVVVADKARKAANIWLFMNAGNLLRADNPELLLGESLKWRFDVSLSLPDLNTPGTGTTNRIGQIHVDAKSGDVLATDTLIDELKATTVYC